MIFVAPQSHKELVLNNKSLVTTDGKEKYAVIKDVPVYRLSCNMELEAAEVAYNGMKGKN